MILTICANPSVDSFWKTDALQKGTTNRSHKETYYPGGKGIHTAFALNELAREVTTLGIWGGQTGHWLQKKCRQKGIIPIGPAIEEWTRICITIQSDTDWNETEFLGSGPSVNEATGQAFQLAYKQYIANHDVKAIIVSGSIPIGFADDLYLQLVEEAKQHQIPAYVDASGPLLEQTLPAHPFGIHINQKEGTVLCGKEHPVDIVDWLREYCGLVAVTAGKNGLYMAFDDKRFHASHLMDETDIISTIGSGDCLLAGLCQAFLTHDDPAYWARFATACGSANCIHPPLGMLKAEDVEEILDQVTVEEF